MFRILHKSLHPWYSILRSNPLLIHFLFQIKIPKNTVIHWDTTTIRLRNSLHQIVSGKDNVLEIGTGPGALLSLWLEKRVQPQKIDAVELSNERVEQARAIAQYNGSTIQIWQSDLFQNVENRYTLIFFNPPYVPTEIGRSMQLTRRLSADGDHVWDGGELGTDVIEKFMETAADHLQPSGRLLIGVQDFYVKRKQIEAIGQKHGYAITHTFKSWINPSVAYLLSKPLPE